MWAVGAWYEDFAPTRDEEIAELLAGTAADPPARPRSAREVRIPVLGPAAEIAGDLVAPDAARRLVLFAHGSGTAVTARATAKSPRRSTTTGSRRCCSICSLPRRSSIAPTSSTSRCSLSASSQRPAGPRADRRSGNCRSATSARASRPAGSVHAPIFPGEARSAPGMPRICIICRCERQRRRDVGQHDVQRSGGATVTLRLRSALTTGPAAGGPWDARMSSRRRSDSTRSSGVI